MYIKVGDVFLCAEAAFVRAACAVNLRRFCAPFLRRLPIFSKSIRPLAET